MPRLNRQGVGALPRQLPSGLRIMQQGAVYYAYTTDITVKIQFFGNINVVVYIPTTTTQSLYPIPGGLCGTLGNGYVHPLTVHQSCSHTIPSDQVASQWG